MHSRQSRFLNVFPFISTTTCILALLTILTGCGGNSPMSMQPSPVSVSPSSSNVLLGNSQQFSANVTGLSNTSVTWSINGVVGGNSTVGTISSSGLYTAPGDLPSPAMITVTATSQAQANASGSASINITSDIAVALAANPANPPFVKTSGTVQLTSLISSAGNPDKNVSWSVNGIANGNATVGTITVNGAGKATYTAPTVNPKPDNVTVAATSTADPNKSARIGFPVVGLVGVASLDKTVADPFTPLLVTGTGFDQGDRAISVLFIPQNGAPPRIAPVLIGSSTILQVMVPALFDPTSGASTSGTVDVQVMEFSGGVTWFSNRITGLQINALAPVPAGVPIGAMTAAFLYSGLNVSASVQASGSGNPSLSELLTALNKYDADVSALIPSINKITNDPKQTVSLPTANGTTATLDAKALALSDQIIQGLVTALVKQGPIAAAVHPPLELEGRTSAAPLSSSGCPPSANNTTFDSALCGTQNFFQNLVNQTPAVVEAEKKVLVNLGLAGLAAFALPEGLLYELAGAGVSAFISSYALTGKSPDGTEIIQGEGTTIADHIASGGRPIIGTTLDIFDVLKAATDAAPPGKGILLSSGIAVPLPGGGTAVTFFDSNGNPVDTLIQVPGKAPQEIIDTTQLVLPPSPQNALSVGVTGDGGGLITSFPEGVSCGPTCTASFPAGTTVGLTVSPASGFELQGWSGACTSSGSCAVVMNSDQNATAKLVKIPQTVLNFAGSFTASVVDHGNGGCPGSATLSGPATMTVTPTNSGFDFSGSATITQSSGICDDYSGTYDFSGSVPNLNGSSVNVTSGIASIIGSFSGNTFSGTWGFSASVGPDVATGTFSLTKQ